LLDGIILEEEQQKISKLAAFNSKHKTQEPLKRSKRYFFGMTPLMLACIEGEVNKFLRQKHKSSPFNIQIL
jgi:hypothetical protein